MLLSRSKKHLDDNLATDRAGAQKEDAEEVSIEWIPKEVFERFKSYPRWLRVGPWSRSSYMSLIAVFLSLLYAFPVSIRSFEVHDYSSEPVHLILLRCLCGAWGLALITIALYHRIYWIFVSYTFWTWIICTMRLCLAGIASVGLPYCGWAALVADVLRFPAVVQSIITVAVWWTVVFPAIFFLSPTGKERAAFLRYNAR